MPGVDYFATEQLRERQTIEIRALRPDDRVEMLAAIGRTPNPCGVDFFTKKGFTDREIDFFMNIDFDSHVALVVRTTVPSSLQADDTSLPQAGRAEIAFVVVDAYQGKGIAGALMRRLAELAPGLRNWSRRSFPKMPRC
jgi:GNAT superfamily N-acetyltransferase